MSTAMWVVYLMFLHWMADFVMQSDEMAQKKAVEWEWLFAHCSVYYVVFAIGTLNPVYGVVLGLIHYPVDFITSRKNRDLWSRGETHWFFVNVGFDQFIHLLTIVLLGVKMGLFK